MPSPRSVQCARRSPSLHDGQGPRRCRMPRVLRRAGRRRSPSCPGGSANGQGSNAPASRGERSAGVRRLAAEPVLHITAAAIRQTTFLLFSNMPPFPSREFVGRMFPADGDAAALASFKPLALARRPPPRDGFRPLPAPRRHATPAAAAWRSPSPSKPLGGRGLQPAPPRPRTASAFRAPVAPPSRRRHT